jgi:polygalacturonase
LIAAVHGIAAAVALADPVLPTIPNHTFNIVDFGASPANTPAQNFTAINAAISACNTAGGGTITVPAGTFVSNPGIVVGNNTDLEIVGTLQAPTFASYGNASTNFLTFNNAHDVGLSGSGTLNGAATFSTSGSDPEWWGGSGLSPPSTRPRLVRINSSTRFLFKDVHIKNAPSFHVSFSGSNSEFTLDNLSVNAPSNAPNTDAIDVTGVNGLIKNCNVSVGDDNVVMKPQGTHCANVEVATCTFGSGHGVSIGGQTNAGMDGFNVHDCTFTGTSNGIHLKAGRGDGGLVTNLTFSNLTMTNVTNPFDVSSYYINGGDVAGPLTPTHIPSGGTQAGAPVLADLPKTFVQGSTPQWQNVTFRNIHINGSSTNNFFYGVPEAAIQNLTLADVIYQNTPSNGLNFVNDADVHWTGAAVAPVQCMRIASLELSGGSTASPAALTQSFSSSLAAQAVTLKNNASLYTNFDPNFDPASVNTVAISGDLDLGKSAGTAGLYTLNGGTLAVGGDERIGNAGTGTLTQSGGFNRVAGTMFVARAAGARGTFTISNGSASLGSVIVNSQGTFNFNGGTIAITGALQASGGQFKAAPSGSRVFRTGAVGVSNGGTIDLNDNDMIVGDGTSTAAVQSLVASARNTPSSGAWLGSGITSSTARANASHSTSLGVISGADYIAANSSSAFDGRTVGSSDTLVKFTWYGDADFNGRVNFDDYVRTDNGFNNHITGWFNGDFDYNGEVNFDDYVLIDLAFNTQSGTLGRALSFVDGSDPSSRGMNDPALRIVREHLSQFGSDYAPHFLAAVPEPAVASSAAVAIGAMLVGRRRRTSQ